MKMMRLDHKRRNRQIVNIGIVCSNGIGISILLSSKLRHHFGDQIRTEVVETRHIKNTDVDFLISTFPIDSKQESICVDPMLSEDDLNKISEKIEFLKKLGIEIYTPIEYGKDKLFGKKVGISISDPEINELKSSGQNKVHLSKLSQYVANYVLGR